MMDLDDRFFSMACCVEFRFLSVKLKDWWMKVSSRFLSSPSE